MGESFIVGVPSEDRAELSDLLDKLGYPAELVQHRYFDATLYVDAILPVVLAPVAWTTVRTWIKARAEIRKSTRISVDGIEIRGFSARESERMIRLLEARVDRSSVEHEE